MSTKIPILSVYDENGNQIEIPAIRGKSAYQYAVDGGFTGTEEEFAEKLAFLMASAVNGTINENNNIILTGALPNGSYTMKYKYEDGTYSDSISVVVGDISDPETEPTYINILTSGDYDVKLNERWSNSSGGFTACDGMISFLIPISDVLNKTVYFKGFPANTTASNSAKSLWMAIANNARVGILLNTSSTSGNVWESTHLVAGDDGVYSIPINSTTLGGTDSAEYLAVNMAFGTTAITAIPTDAIMTIGEEIV